MLLYKSVPFLQRVHVSAVPVGDPAHLLLLHQHTSGCRRVIWSGSICPGRSLPPVPARPNNPPGVRPRGRVSSCPPGPRLCQGLHAAGVSAGENSHCFRCHGCEWILWCLNGCSLDQSRTEFIFQFVKGFRLMPLPPFFSWFFDFRLGPK